MVYWSGNNTFSTASYSGASPVYRAKGIVFDSSIAGSGSGNILIGGVITGLTIPTGVTFTVGDPVFLGASGALAASAPTAAGDAVVKLGTVINIGSTTFDMIFDPKDPILL